MTLKEYNMKYHDIDPFTLGKSIYTLEKIPEYELIEGYTDNEPKRILSEEQKQKLRENLKKAREAKKRSKT